MPTSIVAAALDVVLAGFVVDVADGLTVVAVDDLAVVDVDEGLAVVAVDDLAVVDVDAFAVVVVDAAGLVVVALLFESDPHAPRTTVADRMIAAARARAFTLSPFAEGPAANT